MKIKYLLAILILATAVLCFAAPATAQTPDIQARIAQLMAEIDYLQQQLQALQAQQGISQTWCHTFDTNLRYGDQGGEVSSLITALYKQDLYNGTASTIDDDVILAVVAFQEKYVLDILAPYNLTHGTGFVGTTTRAKLNSLYGCETLPVPESQP